MRREQKAAANYGHIGAHFTQIIAVVVLVIPFLDNNTETSPGKDQTISPVSVCGWSHQSRPFGRPIFAMPV